MSAAGQQGESDESARNHAVSALLTHIVIVDGQQLLYHVTWPCGGDPSVLVASMKARLASLPGECVLVFDRNDMYHPMTTSGCGAPEWSLRTTIYLSTVLFQTETHL